MNSSMEELKALVNNIEALEAQLETAYREVTPHLMEVDDNFDAAKRRRDDVMRRIGPNNYHRIVKKERRRRRDMHNNDR